MAYFPRRSKGCLKSKAITYDSYVDAIAACKRYYDKMGVKCYIFRCPDVPCTTFGWFHGTTKYPSGVEKRKLNKKLLDFYAEKDRFGTGRPKKRQARKAFFRKSKVNKQLPYMRWEDDGGAMRPQDLED